MGDVKRYWWRAADAALEHAGRLCMVFPGAIIIGVALWNSGRWPSAVIGTWAAAGCILLGLGYFGPYIKSLQISRQGVALDTHDQRRAEAEHTTSEVDELSDDAAPEPAGPVDEDEVRAYARFMAATAGLSVLLNPQDGPLAGCALHLYLYDDESGGLVRTAFESSYHARNEPPWPPGVGVVGTAWTTRTYQSAIGNAASDETFNLDSDRQNQHLDLSAVAATPVFNSGESVIGVLSVSERGTMTGQEKLARPETANEMIGIASIVSRYLVDLLGWFPDDAAG